MAVLSALAAMSVLPAVAGAATPGVFTLAAGQTATLSHSELIGCDATEWGYKLVFHPWRLLGAKRQTCPKAGPFTRDTIANPQPKVTIGPFRTPEILRLFLIDEYPPAFTFFSSDRRHTTIVEAGPRTWRIAVRDSNFGRYGPFSVPRPLHGQGNLRTTLTISAP